MEADEMPTHHDISEAQRDNVAAMLFGDQDQHETVTQALSGLVAEACNPDEFPPRPPLQRLFDHVTMARGLMAASRKAYQLGEVPRASLFADTAELFLAYAVGDIAEIDAIATHHEMGEPQ